MKLHTLGIVPYRNECTISLRTTEGHNSVDNKH